MHFGTGMWGVFFTGLLAKQEYMFEAYVTPDPTIMSVHRFNRKMEGVGAFYKHSNGYLLACQIIGILAIIGWVCGTMIPFFGIFKLAGALRIPPEVEEVGLDRSKHGGSAYNGAGVSPAAPGNDVMRNQNGASAKVLPLNA
jgi:Amt family ammonium transporter